MLRIRTGVEAAALAALLAAAPGAAGAQQAGRVVECHDAVRGIVQPMRPHDCEGEIVDAERAAELREQARLKRARALRSAGGTAPAPPPPGAAVTRHGTAFPIAPGGHVLTAAHVVTGCAPIRLIAGDGEEQAATLLDSDDIRDLALLRGEREATPFAALAALPEAGMAVVAIGYPEEGRARVRPRIDHGHVRQTGAGPGAGLYIAADIGLRRGNSGGPLLDADGNLLGLVISKLDRAAFYAATGSAGEDIAVAVAIPSLAEFLEANGLKLGIAAPRPPTGAGGADAAAGRVLRVLCGPKPR